MGIRIPVMRRRTRHMGDVRALYKTVRKTSRALPLQIPRAHRADARMNTREDERDMRLGRRSLSGRIGAQFARSVNAQASLTRCRVIPNPTLCESTGEVRDLGKQDARTFAGRFLRKSPPLRHAPSVDTLVSSYGCACADIKGYQDG